jgi:hypothetical protein
MIEIITAIGFALVIGSFVHIQKRLDIIIRRIDTMDEKFMSPKQIFDKYN